MKRVLLATGLALLLLLGREAASPARFVNPSLAVWLFDSPLLATYTPTPIKSIQYGNATIAQNGGSATATITSVDTTAAIVRWLGGHNNAAFTNYCDNANGVELTNATTVTVKRDSESSTNPGVTVVKFVVVEYLKQFVKSLQGPYTISLTGLTTATQTITSVNTAKSEAVFQGWKYGAGLNTDCPAFYVWPSMTLTNATTITVVRGTATNAISAYASVVEFK